jgi:two-component system response regulator HydG
MRAENAAGNKQAGLCAARRVGRRSRSADHASVWHAARAGRVRETWVSERSRILIVDDEELVLLVLRDGLVAFCDKYEVETAQSGLEALRKFKDMGFDLVITDLRMADMDGVELTEAIRAWDPEAMVIWITAYDCHKMRAEAERLAVYRCLDKPLEIPEIRAVVSEALEEKRARSAPSS